MGLKGTSIPVLIAALHFRWQHMCSFSPIRVRIVLTMAIHYLRKPDGSDLKGGIWFGDCYIGLLLTSRFSLFDFVCMSFFFVGVIFL